jgi:hypothetical protein
MGDTYFVGSLTKELTSATAPTIVDDSLHSPEEGNRSRFRNVVFSSYLEFRMMNEVHKLSESNV